MAITIQHFYKQHITIANEIISAAFKTTNSRVMDLTHLLTIQPDGWFMAMKDMQPVGTVGAVDFGSFAWIGMMTVHPNEQGQGIGYLLMEGLLDWLSTRGNRVALLDATKEGEPLYRRFGFEEYDRVNQYICKSELDRKTVVDKEFRHQGIRSFPTGVSQINQSDIPAIVEFDRPIFGADRSRVLRLYSREFADRAFVARDHSGNINGYIFVQRRKLGPWVAQNPEVAESLLQTALGLDFDQGGPMVIAPAANSVARSLLEHNGFTQQDSLSHMQRGGNKSPTLRGQIFGQASYAIG